MPDQPTRRLPADEALGPATDHPTRRLPAGDAPGPPPGPGRTYRLQPSGGPTPIMRTCRWCGGEVRRFRATVQTNQGAMPVELENPEGPHTPRFLGRPPHAPCYGWVCHDCGYTEFYIVGASRLWAE